ncbi:Krueppel homolog 1-like isoform X2 [Sitodiplosis mosellana]|uniref:Krueppel homolog 1-like isoform X2 n=1 Tax=Sitodiplosis mosellana TaxID=263140 RepID=UPI0024441FE9|nr:Krueppel homolog 1-like isoform X2 [Sitodiplosis mosellana]
MRNSILTVLATETISLRSPWANIFAVDSAGETTKNDMVYYTSIPMMPTDHHSVNGGDLRQLTNLSSNNQNETQLYNISSSNMTDPKLMGDSPKTMITLTNVTRAAQQQQQQQQQQHATPISTTTNGNSTKQQFKCEQCNMFFGSKSAHTSHMKSHGKTNGTRANGSNGTSTNPSEPHQCDVCKKTFAVPARLVRHYRTHTGERPFECEFCHKMFSVKENLQVHRRIHTKERPYKCDRCGRAFEHSGKLHRHMRIHTGERPHKCSVCSKTFIQSGQLVIHMRTHTGEKPYKCPVEGCGKGFTCSKQLKVHSRTHTGEKPYHCDICFRDFGYNHVLKLHRVQHYGSKCYKCTICDETFKSKKEMEAHIKGHAKDLPDDEPAETATEAVAKSEPVKVEQLAPAMDVTQTIRASPTSTMPMLSPSPNSNISASNMSALPTPRDSSSDTHSDGDEMSYYTNIFTRFDQKASNNEYKVQSHGGGGVNPALLAAVSIAASQNEADDLTTLRTHLPVSSATSSATNALLAAVNEQETAIDHSFIYEPLAVMHQQGYFNPAPRVGEFKSSIHASNDIVKRVEAALASAAELTPPRSSPESPDRSSSPDSDVVMADRDVMSLPLRKRKNYPRDGQGAGGQGDDGQPAQIMRMSSVIQFAKAS